MTKLRDYQLEANNQALNSLTNSENFLLNMATGSGKTVVFLNIANEFIKNGKKVLILVNDVSLFEQTIYSIKKNIGLNEKDICVERDKKSEILEGVKKKNLKNLSISTRQTMAYTGAKRSIARYNEIPIDTFDLIIIDEAHHIGSNQYQEILNRFSNTPILGVTATPQLANGVDISLKYFNRNEYYYGIKKAMLDDNLSHIKVVNYAIPELIDKLNNSLRSNKNDENISDIMAEKLIEDTKIKEQFINIIAKNAKDKKTAVFCPGIDSAKEIVNMLQKKYPEYNVLLLHSKLDNSDEVKEQYEKSGKNTIMVNVKMLTEGYDCKDIDCIVNLRATNSEVLYRQIAGRETRIAEGKSDALFVNVFDGCDKVLQPKSIMRERGENLDSNVIKLIGKIINSKETDDLLKARLRAEQILKYTEKYGIPLTFKDEAKFGLTTEKSIQQLEKEIFEKDCKTQIASLKNPLFNNLKTSLENLKISNFSDASKNDKEMLNKIGFNINCFQLKDTASLVMNEVTRICKETGRNYNDIADALKKDNEIYSYNYKMESYFQKNKDVLKDKLKDFGLCDESTFKEDFARLSSIRINFVDEMDTNSTQDEEKALELIGLEKKVFKTGFQRKEAIKIVNKNRVQAEEPTIEECLETAKKYNLYNYLNKIKGDDLSYITDLDKQYQQFKDVETKEDLDDAIDTIKKKIEKTNEHSQSKHFTVSKQNNNNILSKGGGMRHG